MVHETLAETPKQIAQMRARVVRKLTAANKEVEQWTREQELIDAKWNGLSEDQRAGALREIEGDSDAANKR